MKTKTLETSTPFLSSLLAAGVAEEGAFLRWAEEAPPLQSTTSLAAPCRGRRECRPLGSTWHPWLEKTALEMASGPINKIPAWCQTTSGLVALALPCLP